MNTLSEEDRQTLLRLAREAIENAVRGKALPPIDIHTVSLALREFGASFVTLTIHDELRGCIGALEAYQPLIEDVREHAVAAQAFSGEPVEVGRAHRPPVAAEVRVAVVVAQHEQDVRPPRLRGRRQQGGRAK